MAPPYLCTADGSPRILYHGTAETFERFRCRRNDLGLHFGSLEQASDRIRFKSLRDGEQLAEGTNIRPVLLKIRNPLRLRDAGSWSKENVCFALSELPEFQDIPGLRRKTLGELRQLIESRGYDGVVYRNTGEVGGVSALFRYASHLRRKFWPQRKSCFSVEEQKTPEYRFYSFAHSRVQAISERRAHDSYIAFSPDQVVSIWDKQPI